MNPYTDNGKIEPLYRNHCDCKEGCQYLGRAYLDEIHYDLWYCLDRTYPVYMARHGEGSQDFIAVLANGKRTFLGPTVYDERPLYEAMKRVRSLNEN